MKRHVLSLGKLGTDSIHRMVKRATAIAAAPRTQRWDTLEGRIVGIFFPIPSTRTRSSFSVGAMKLGAQVIAYGSGDLQISTGETLADTGRVLSGYMDALVIRTNGSDEEMEELGRQDDMSIINAMSASEHPTQALADLSTIQHVFGRFTDIEVLYVGEGNNTATALALAVAHTPGMKATFVTPEKFGMDEAFMARAAAAARLHGSEVEQHHDLLRLPKNVDIVYATRWQTMGASKGEDGWERHFDGFTVTREMMDQVSRPKGTVFLHDLPAVRGKDVTDEVLDGPQSRAFLQARYKMYSAMSVLEWCTGAL